MCEATVTSPVNTGEQPLAETAPTPAETNGQSQPPPEVVPPVSSPAEDRAQPTPEQVAPPTATDVCPELSFPRDIAPLPPTETGASRNTKKCNTTPTGVKLPRKRKRLNGNAERNVKKKSSKSSSPNEASSPVASDDEQVIDIKVPKRRRGITRYTAAKQQLDDALKETDRLKNVIALLESEIDVKNKELAKLRKNDVSQKSEIKKLSILVDYQKHQLRSDSDTRRDVPDCKTSSSVLSNSDIDTSEVDITALNRHPRKSTKAVSSNISSISHSKSVIDCDAPRSQPESRLESTPTAHPRPQVAVIGSSIVRGVGSGLNKRGVDATTFTYPGCEVPQIRERISSILTRSYQPDTVVLQCGGNDLQNNRTPAETMEQIDILVKEVKRCRPGVIVVVNKIPPRGRDDTLLHNISSLNQLISNMARDSNQNILCLDPCPKMFRYYAKDEVHLNRSGKRFYVYGLAKSLINFHWPQLQSTR